MEEKMNFEEFDAFVNHTCNYICERDGLNYISQSFLKIYCIYYINSFEELYSDTDCIFIEKNEVFKDLEKLSRILKEECMSEDEYNLYSEFFDRHSDCVYRLALTDEYLSNVYIGQKDLYVIGNINTAVEKAKVLAMECSVYLDQDEIRECGISIFHEGEYVGEVKISEEMEDQ